LQINDGESMVESISWATMIRPKKQKRRLGIEEALGGLKGAEVCGHGRD